jgi:hypothetical protein
VRLAVLRLAASVLVLLLTLECARAWSETQMNIPRDYSGGQVVWQPPRTPSESRARIRRPSQGPCTAQLEFEQLLLTEAGPVAVGRKPKE